MISPNLFDVLKHGKSITASQIHTMPLLFVRPESNEWGVFDAASVVEIGNFYNCPGCLLVMKLTRSFLDFALKYPSVDFIQFALLEHLDPECGTTLPLDVAVFQFSLPDNPPKTEAINDVSE